MAVVVENAYAMLFSSGSGARGCFFWLAWGLDLRSFEPEVNH